MIEKEPLVDQLKTLTRKGVAITIASIAFLGCTPHHNDDGKLYSGEQHGLEVRCYGPGDLVTVEKGDTLLELADRNNVGMPTLVGGIDKDSTSRGIYADAIGDLNGLSDPDKIQVGATLILPNNCNAEIHP